MRDAVIVWALMACGAVSACTAQAPGGSEPATTRVEAPPPLIGAWRSSVDVQSGVFATAKGVEFMYVFHGDRTMVESSNYDAAPPVPPAYGVWRMIPGTGLEHEAKYEFFTTAASPPDQFKTGAGWLPSGRGVITERITLARDGKSFTSTIRYELFDATGAPIAGGGTATGAALESISDRGGLVRAISTLILGLAIAGCHSGVQETPPMTTAAATEGARPSAYFDTAGRKDVLAGGARMIPIKTPKGEFRVWTKRVGNNPRLKVLLLHGGPAVTHEYFEAFDSYFPAAGVEYYYYDQLGSAFSDQPTDDSLWEIGRFVDEVEQVRVALGLDQNNFVLLGHSWGGLLAMEYALAHQDHLKGLIVSSMMASVPAYNDYAHKVLMPAMDQNALAEIQKLEAANKTEDPRYMELLVPNFYEQHFLRMPAAEWPDPVNRAMSRLNRHVYTLMQGPSEMGAGGRMANWDRSNDLAKITVPTLVIGAKHDTMDPAYMEGMAKKFPKGRYLFCPNGGHMALYDDQQTYMTGIVRFLKDVESSRP